MTGQILAVQKMQDYIEAHLKEEITLATLAGICNFSPWYAHRLFREYTGYAPAEYIRRMRLAKAAQRLKTEHTKIIDVAFGLGFASVDGYTRAFHKEFGINPGEYAKNPVPIKLFVAYGVKFKELKKEFSLVANSNVFIQVIHKPSRRVIIKRGIKADNYFDYLMFQGEPFNEEDYRRINLNRCLYIYCKFGSPISLVNVMLESDFS